MRRLAWGFLLLFAFAVPWEYSLELGEPLGNIARIVGLLLLLAAVPAVLQAGRMRTPGTMQWLTLALYLWFCCTYFWTVEPTATLEKIRGYFQELMIVWLVWEFAESPEDLRSLIRAYIAGSWVLALLTLASFGSAEAMAANQIRFVAEGQDPNDVARYLDLGLPLAVLLATSERRWPARLLALGYLPVGLVAVVLTASRGGFLAAGLALAGCGLLLIRSRPRQALTWAAALPVLAGSLWFGVPHETLQRLATIPEQLQGGDLNQRWNIWEVGWQAFARAPVMGSGAGTFVSAARTNPLDTAHNSALSIVVGGGLIALMLASAIVAFAVRAAFAARGPIRISLGTVLAVWVVASMVDTTEENRSTWLLLGLIALSGRLANENPQGLAECFPDAGSAVEAGLAPSPACGPAH
jgi:O-antigen ligase